MSRSTLLWVVLGVALVLGGALASYLQAGRVDDEKPGVVGTLLDDPVATLVAVGDCPWGEASCILAQGIERALQAGNVGAVIEFSEALLVECPGTPPEIGGPFPLCNGAAADEARFGYGIGRRYSEGGVVDKAGLRSMLERFLDSIRADASDSVGSGGLKFYAFSCSTPAVAIQNLSCARVGIILSAIVGEGTDTHRELLVFWAIGGYLGRTLPFTEVWDGIILDGELPVLFKTGGSLPDLGEVHVVDQSLR